MSPFTVHFLFHEVLLVLHHSGSRASAPSQARTHAHNHSIHILSIPTRISSLGVTAAGGNGNGSERPETKRNGNLVSAKLLGCLNVLGWVLGPMAMGIGMWHSTVSACALTPSQ
ncbi:hypothetical protein BZA05DRAFT_392265 [Tricharina praecox]|uniref:uncharacterized protein n=1 Tax=Tricharina praecox TaxID=43433 RepID=UPI00221F1F79|nr:uncharacterized protein BZA05DRAFT_392265 [Tricharina praecox]KAI5854694.1 hypothetical protein BZA05DRAFT_392265 [Tricharina praecox]